LASPQEPAGPPVLGASASPKVLGWPRAQHDLQAGPAMEWGLASVPRASAERLKAELAVSVRAAAEPRPVAEWAYATAGAAGVYGAAAPQRAVGSAHVAAEPAAAMAASELRAAPDALMAAEAAEWGAPVLGAVPADALVRPQAAARPDAQVRRVEEAVRASRRAEEAARASRRAAREALRAWPRGAVPAAPSRAAASIFRLRWGAAPGRRRAVRIAPATAS
jgi:hypothetical protein